MKKKMKEVEVGGGGVNWRRPPGCPLNAAWLPFMLKGVCVVGGEPC